MNKPKPSSKRRVNQSNKSVERGPKTSSEDVERSIPNQLEPNTNVEIAKGTPGKSYDSN